MDQDRIERALRHGPPDEPAYRPGSHRERPRRVRLTTVAFALVGALAVVAVGLGAGLGILRPSGTGGIPDVVTITAALTGTTWTTDPIPVDEWSDGLVERGFDPADIAAFLEHDPFADTVRYRLTFGKDIVVVGASYDGGGFVTLSQARWVPRDDGRLDLTDVIPGAAPEELCSVEVPLAIGNVTLVTDAASFGKCGVDERIANTAFFALAPYTRTSP
ncbi:MAG TPA: hypothetical protein VFY23_11090 [Candidatus Limnocylindrales bacterium]|nr:hypothetical protein [Candidatus Limnocylindrales bacterium]